MKHGFLYLFSLLLVLFLLVSCEKKKEELPVPEAGDASIYYEVVPVALPETERLLELNSRREDGGFSVRLWHFEEASGENGGYPVYSRAVIDTDGNVLSVSDDTAASAKTSFSLSDGSMIVSETGEDGVQLTVSLVRDGETRFSLDPAEPLNYRYPAQGTENYAALAAGDILRVSDARLYDRGEQGRMVVLLTTEGLLALDENGAVLWKNLSAKNPIGISVTVPQNPDGTDGQPVLLYLSTDAQGAQKLTSLDPQTGKAAETPALPAEVTGTDLFGQPKLFMGEKYAFYVSVRRALYGILCTRDAEGALVCRTETVIDWDYCCIDGLSVSELFFLDDTRIGVISRSLDDPAEFCALVLRQLDEEHLPVRTELQMAVFDNAMHSTVLKYNRSSQDFRIVEKDYTIYGDDAKQRFELDYAAGYQPDLFVLTGYYGGEPLGDNYARKGMFLDLASVWDENVSFPRDKLLGYVKKPYENTAGKQFLFPLQPSSGCWFSNGTYGITGVQTPEEAAETCASLRASGVSCFSDSWEQVSFWRYALAAGIDGFVDYDAASCSFADGRFASLCQACLSVPAGEPSADYGTERERLEAVRSGKAALFYSTGINSLFDWVEMRSLLGGAVIPVGYPNAERLLYTDDASSRAVFAVSSQTEHIGAAMRLLSDYLTPSGTVTDWAYPGTPYTRDDIYAQLALFDGKTVVVNDRMLSYLDDAQAADAPGVKYKPSQADAEEYISYLDSIGRSVSNYSPAMGILDEELSQNAPRTPEQIADIIQSRITLFLAEQYQN